MRMGILCLRGGKGSETTGDKQQALLSAGQPLDSGGELELSGSWRMG